MPSIKNEALIEFLKTCKDPILAWEPCKKDTPFEKDANIPRVYIAAPDIYSLLDFVKEHEAENLAPPDVNCGGGNKT